MIACCQANAELNVLVYFDLEKTDATNDIQICQIACISPDKATYIYVAFKGFVLYAGGDYALYPNIMLLVQVMAYVMSGTFAADKVIH